MLNKKIRILLMLACVLVASTIFTNQYNAYSPKNIVIYGSYSSDHFTIQVSDEEGVLIRRLIPVSDVRDYFNKNDVPFNIASVINGELRLNEFFYFEKEFDPYNKSFNSCLENICSHMDLLNYFDNLNPQDTLGENINDISTNNIVRLNNINRLKNLILSEVKKMVPLNLFFQERSETAICEPGLITLLQSLKHSKPLKPSRLLKPSFKPLVKTVVRRK